MGCDIHMHVEYKHDKFIGKDANKQLLYKKVWVCGDYFKINPYYDPYTAQFAEERPFCLVGFCDNRNYCLFATLADVRNYGDTSYIDDPRGLPDDVTKEVKEDSDSWGDDGHSHSYFTLKELIDFQKNAPPMKFRGMISPEAQKALDEKGILPEFWCQGTTEKGWAWREWTEENTVLLPLIEALKKRAAELCVIYHWQGERQPEKAYEYADNIRIVFWFDN